MPTRAVVRTRPKAHAPSLPLANISTPYADHDTASAWAIHFIRAPERKMPPYGTDSFVWGGGARGCREGGASGVGARSCGDGGKGVVPAGTGGCGGVNSPRKKDLRCSQASWRAFQENLKHFDRVIELIDRRTWGDHLRAIQAAIT